MRNIGSRQRWDEAHNLFYFRSSAEHRRHKKGRWLQVQMKDHGGKLILAILFFINKEAAEQRDSRRLKRNESSRFKVYPCQRD